MNPNLEASLKVAVTAFLGGVLGALEPYFAGGVPSESQWKTIASAALFAGLIAAWHRFSPAPSQVAK